MGKPLSISFENTQHAFAYKSDRSLRKSYRLYSLMRYGFLVRAGSFLAPLALKLHLPIKGLIRNTIFELFCGGETLEEAATTAAGLHAYAVKCTLDYGVERSEGEKNYDLAVSEFQKAIRYAGSQEDIPMISLKITGFARFQLLEKYHSGLPLTKKEEAEWQKVYERIKTICQTAYQHHTGLLIDAEESWIQGPIDLLARQMMQQFNKREAIIYNTFQLYRQGRFKALMQQWQQSREEGYLPGAKLVRGAYMEKERKRAKEKNDPSPIQPDKAATDREFNKAVRWSLKHLDGLALFIGTHNEESCMRAAQFMHDHQIPYDHPHVHFSQLYGMSDNITFNLARAGFSVSKYLPYGPVKHVLPYLIRRSRENSSISGQMGREQRLLKKEILRRKREKAENN